MSKKSIKHSKLSITTCISLLAFTSGCFKSADKDKAELISSPSLEAISESALATSSFEKVSQRREKWWKVFENSELSALIEEAIENSPTLHAAEARVVAAQASAKSVRSKLFPELSSNALDNWVYLSKYGLFRDFFPTIPGDPVPSKFNEIDLTLNFSYEIDFWGKNRKKFAEALGLAVSMQMEKVQAELILCQAVAFSFFEWQVHSAEKALLCKWLEAEKRLSQDQHSRYEYGIENTLGPIKQRQRFEEIHQKILDIDKNLEIDLYFLKNLIGKGPETPLELETQPEKLRKKIQIPEHLGLDLIAQRPDLMAQIWKVSSAAKAIGVAKTEFYPNVNLAALGSLSSLSFSRLFDWGARQGALSPAIHLPIFTGGRLKANLDQKVAEFNQEAGLYNEMVLQAAKQVAENVATFVSLQKQNALQTKVVELQTKAHSVHAMRFEKGVDPIKPALDSLSELYYEEIKQIHLNHAEVLSALQIIQSLGGGMPMQTLPSSLYP